MVWRMEAGEVSFYRLIERAEGHGRRMIGEGLQRATAAARGAGLCSMVWRCSWASWCSDW